MRATSDQMPHHGTLVLVAKRTAGHTMNNKIHSLALLVNLGIYGVALPAMAEDQTDSAAVSHEDTIVVTAAQQNLQAPGVSTLPQRRFANIPPPAMYRS